MLTPVQVAKKANVSVNSVRNWSKDYAELLSPTARGEKGPRLFSEEDVEVICNIAALRKSGVPPGEVTERVRNMDVVPPVVDVEPTLQERLQEPPTGTQTSIVEQTGLQIAQNALQSRVDALQRYIETQAAAQRAEQHDRLWTFGMGVWVGMVTMGMIFFAVWLVVNGW